MRAGSLAMLLWLVPAGIVSAAGDYLSALEAEARDTGARTAAAGGESVPVVSEPGRASRVADTLVPDLGFEEFGNELRDNYSGTHLLYMKLSKEQRRKAWRSYLDNNDVRAVREHIVSMLSSG